MNDTELKEIILTPEKYYEAPAQVVADARLDDDEKRKVLQAWLSNEKALLRAAGEGLDGGERQHLSQVIYELEKMK